MAKKAKISSIPPFSLGLEKKQNSKVKGHANSESKIRQLPDLSNLNFNQKLTPGLYILSTPIGNLMDVSLRSLIILNSADLIAAEDTRVTRKLLNYFQIKNSIISYNENSSLKVRHKIIKLISENKLIALVSDAGTPLISDPGFKLVKECVKRELEVFSIPGPTAFVAALVASGIEPSPVTFIGFLPIKESSRNKKLFELSQINSTIVIFVSGRNLISTLEEILSSFGERQIAIARELTKIHEEIFRGSLSYYIGNFKSKLPPKGEITIVISRENNFEDNYNVDKLDNKILEELNNYALKEAVDIVKNKTGLPKRMIYKRALELKNDVLK